MCVLFFRAGVPFSQLAQKHGRILLTEERFFLVQKKNKSNFGSVHAIAFPPQGMFIRKEGDRSLPCSKNMKLFVGSFKYWTGGI